MQRQFRLPPRDPFFRNGGLGLGNKFLWQDYFDGSTLNPRWEFLRKGTMTATVSGGEMVLNSGGTAPSFPNEPIILAKIPPQDFSILVKGRATAGNFYASLYRSANERALRATYISTPSISNRDASTTGWTAGPANSVAFNGDSAGNRIYLFKLSGTEILAGISDTGDGFSYLGKATLASYLEGRPDYLSFESAGANPANSIYDYAILGANFPLPVTPATIYDDEFDGAALDAKWATVNQTTAPTATLPGISTLTLAKTATDWSYVTQDITGLTGDWQFTARCRRRGSGGYSGLVVCKSDYSKALVSLTSLIQSQNAGFAFAANSAGWTPPPDSVGYVRWTKSGTNIIYSDSADGITFTNRFTQAISTHLGSADRIGMAIYGGTSWSADYYWIRKTA
jgi:hypothetical protein